MVATQRPAAPHPTWHTNMVYHWYGAAPVISPRSSAGHAGARQCVALGDGEHQLCGSRVSISPQAMSSLLDRLRAAVQDRYTVDREIGRGGMASVFLATDRRHGRAVAIKVMDPHLVGQNGADRFLREIEIASRLTHPHIV